MLLTPTDVQGTVARQHDHVAAMVRDRRIGAAMSPAATGIRSVAATPRPVGRLRAGLGRLAASLAALGTTPLRVNTTAAAHGDR